MQNSTTLTTCSTRQEPDVIISLLASAGIEAITAGGDLGGVNPIFGRAFGIVVLVDSGRLQEAQSLLSAPVENPGDLIQRSASSSQSSPPPRFCSRSFTAGSAPARSRVHWSPRVG